MKTTFLFFLCTFSFLQVQCQFQNVLISSQGEPEEPTIMINPKNPSEVIAGANIDQVYYSHDGGSTWTEGSISSTFGVWGDPCLVVDTAGAYYFLHLSNPQQGSWIDRIVCQKSTDHGVQWNNGSYTYLDGSKAQDKEWATVDRSNNNIYVTWTQFDEYASTATNDSSIILFTKTTDGGQTWSPVKRLSEKGGDCLDDDNTVEGAVPVVGPNGEVYVAWSGPLGIMFDRSTDHGETWLDHDIKVGDQPGGWTFDIPGISRCNGLPITACDTSHGPYRGNIYVNWSDQRFGTSNTDIWLAKSTDGGNSWSEAKRVNDDSTDHQQFFTWMTLDPVNGYLYFIFYDRRNYSNTRTDVYMAVSRDGGETFENLKISQSYFLPNANVFFGDYTNISVFNNIVRPIWTRLDGYNLSLWTALINMEEIGIETPVDEQFTVEDTYPNPSSEITYFSYKIRRLDRVTLKVYDLLGNTRVVLRSQEWMKPGKYIEQLDVKQFGLSPGIYFFELNNSWKTQIRRFVVND